MRKAGAFLKPFPFFLYYFLLSLFSPSGNNTPDWLWHSTWDREATGMECFPKRMLQICQLWSTSGFLSWPSVSQSVSSVAPVVSDSLRPHELQHARPPCPSPTPGVYSNSCPSSRWCHPAISSSVIPFSCPQSLSASGSSVHYNLQENALYHYY